jgi:hypothetical protein
MKKSKLKYQLTTCKNNKEVVQDLDLKGLYKQAVRKKWQKISGQPYQCKILKKQPSHVSLYLAFQLQYSPVQTATEHFATVLAPYPNWSDSVGHPEFCTDKVVLKSSAIFFSRQHKETMLSVLFVM